MADVEGRVLVLVSSDGDASGSVSVLSSGLDGAWQELARVAGVAEVTAFAASDSWLLMAGTDTEGGQRLWWSSDGVTWRTESVPRRLGALEVADIAVSGDSGYVTGSVDLVDALLPEAIGPVLTDAVRTGTAWMARTNEGLWIAGPLSILLWASDAGDSELLEAWDAQESSPGLWRIDLVGDGDWTRVSSMDGLAARTLVADGDVLVADVCHGVVVVSVQRGRWSDVDQILLVRRRCAGRLGGGG